MWLITALVIGFRLGQEVQQYQDNKIIVLLDETIKTYKDFVEGKSSVAPRVKKPYWT